jgi:hypothetical protein
VYNFLLMTLSRFLHLAGGALAALTITAAAQAVTLNLQSSYLIGYAAPGVPADPYYETERLQALVDWYNAGSANGTSLGGFFNGTTVTLLAGSGVPDPDLPDAVFGFKEEDENVVLQDIDVSGYTYLMGKYGKSGSGQISVYFYVGGLGSVNLSNTVSFGTAVSGALSHWSLFNPHGVPDGAATAALLGLSLLGLGVIARRRKA